MELTCEASTEIVERHASERLVAGARHPWGHLRAGTPKLPGGEGFWQATSCAKSDEASRVFGRGPRSDDDDRHRIGSRITEEILDELFGTGLITVDENHVWTRIRCPNGGVSGVEPRKMTHGEHVAVTLGGAARTEGIGDGTAPRDEHRYAEQLRLAAWGYPRRGCTQRPRGRRRLAIAVVMQRVGKPVDRGLESLLLIVIERAEHAGTLHEGLGPRESGRHNRPVKDGRAGGNLSKVLGETTARPRVTGIGDERRQPEP